MGASNAGAKVLLLERNSYRGGEATHIGIGAFRGFYSCGKSPERVVLGVWQMALDKIERLGPVCDEIVSATGNRNFNFHQEYLKCVLGDLIGKSGADCLLHSQVVAADVLDDRIVCISCEDVEGLFTVKASSFVDATGDANLAHLCGAKTTWGATAAMSKLRL